MSEQTESTQSNQRDDKQLVVRVAQLSDVGRVRTENQDFSILSSAEDEVDVGKGRLMVVADGMGGHRGGATASRMAGTIIKDEYFRDPDKDVVASLKRALEKANARIFAESEPARLKPGHFSWNELISPNTDASADFYGRLFGWQATPFAPEGMPAGGPPYIR